MVSQLAGLFDKIRNREHVDVELLLKEATASAAGDTKAFLNDTTICSQWTASDNF